MNYISANSPNDYTSISAPSHKHSFDHAQMYPAVDPSVTGPIRRYRSMTPSLIRSGSNSRGVDFNNPGGSPGSVHSSRGYHPYAGYASSSSRNSSTHGSAQSSPSVYPVPLAAAGAGGSGSAGGGADSRASSFSGSAALQDQMRRMMMMEAGEGTMYSDAAYRTDSPASFVGRASPAAFAGGGAGGGAFRESPAPYAMELPVQFGSAEGFVQQHPHQPQHQQSSPLYDKNGYTMPVQHTYVGMGEGYYPQQHVTL